VTGGPGLRLGWLTVDAHDPDALAAWWRQALGFEEVSRDDDGEEVAISGPGWHGSRWNILFLRTPDPKERKNRLHLDLIPDDQAAEVARLESLGATKVDIGQRDVSWVVLADPEGNELCVLTPRADPTES
jgi:catechol 2,3-dioxygenase-like lactoylglutathione lyase family enzyme